MRYGDQIPNIGRERWSILYVHDVEGDFEQDAPRIRELVRTNAESRARIQQAYDYLLAHVPSTRDWASATSTPFCTREQLREYLQAFHDYIFGDRPEPITPPPNDELCPHQRNERGYCIFVAAESEAEDNGR